MFNRLTLLVTLFACIGSWTWGYNAAIIASSLAQPTFSTYMKITTSNASALEGTANALFSVGGFFGCLGSVYANDKHGRPVAIMLGCVLCVLAAGLTAGSVHIAMFIMGRLVMGLGVGNLLVLVPLYQSEIVPYNHRGLLVGLHGVMLCVGYASANWVGYGFFFVKNGGIAWRLPLGIGGVPPLVLAIFCPILPQSPRWLIGKGRTAEARVVCQRLLRRPKSNEADQDKLWQVEFSQMVEQHEHYAEMPSSWRSLFTLPHYRRRALIGFFTMFFVQCSGMLVITNYVPLLYGRLGYDSKKQLLLAAGWQTMSPFGNMLNAYCLDKIGRRVLLSVGLYLCAIMVLGEAISVALFTKQHGAQAPATAAVCFLFFTLAVYCSTQDASSYVFVSEIFPTHIRAKGVAISTSGLFFCTLIFVSAAPAAFDSINYGYYILIAICAIVGATVEWFYWPETRGMTLEEVAVRFWDPAPSSRAGQVVDDWGTEQDKVENGTKLHLERESR